MIHDRRKPYPFDQIEPKWQAHWDQHQTFHAPNPGEPGFDPTRPKFYILDMFPYPSGAGLHVGHPEGYTATDIIARFKRQSGFNVLHPMGWDAFGLPAEQYAIKTGQHPAITTARNIAHFKGQLQRIGFAYDWQREVNTTTPSYYRWTQWIFLQLYGAWFNPASQRAEPISTYTGTDPASARLAYVAEVPVNWCADLGTVLANEEVIDGKSEVGGFPVVRKPMRQWMLRITAYAERLIHELDGLAWPDSIKALQRNWIGRSEGAEVRFEIAPGSAGVSPAVSGVSPESGGSAGAELSASRPADQPLPRETRGTAGETPALPVFTTRPDTLFGATYMVLAPEHGLVEQIVTEEQWPAVREYRERTARKSDLERTDLAKDKSGVWTGAYAINPVNSERIPIWIADYVLAGYGTGTIMGVPAHDARDWEFAQKFALPIREVVSPTPRLGLGGSNPCSAEPLTCFIGEGFAINSGPLDGLPTPEAKAEITSRLEALGIGKKTVTYKLRDWLFSRQRYWGEPFPIVWEGGKHRAIPEAELPLIPPELADFQPTGTGEPPLAKATDWLRYSAAATRETNTMPQWAGSCWYYLRYTDPQSTARFVGREAESYWMTGRLPGEGENVERRTSNVERRSSERSSEGELGEEQRTQATGEHAPLLTSTFDVRRSTFDVSPPPHPGGVDLYVGGTEHAVLHLLYARFWHKALFDLGHVSTPEPFQRLVNQGLIMGEDGQKMSKSRGNVVNPDTVIEAYGADSLRCYEMFMGPLEQSKPWSMTGVEGVSRFLARVWRLIMEENQAGEWAVCHCRATASVAPGQAERPPYGADLTEVIADIEPSKALKKVMHATIKKVEEDIEALSFNTAIAQMMIFVNALIPERPRPLMAIRALLQVLNPFAPHLTEELWQRLALPGELANEPWPAWDPAALVEDELELPVQVNGKVRDRITVATSATPAEIEEAALLSPKVQEHIDGKPVKKVVVVPGKLVNVVV